MIAENKLGKEEITTSIQVQQTADLRSVLRKNDEKDKEEIEVSSTRQDRVVNTEEKVRGEIE